MKITNIVVAILLVAAHACAAAGEDISTRLRQIQSEITSATVAVVPADELFYTPLNAAQVWKFGCTFDIAQGPDLLMLFTLLDRADIKSEVGGGTLDFRLSIELSPRSGPPVKLFFDGMSRMDGLVHGTINGDPVTVTADFAKRFYAWSATHKTKPAIPSRRCPGELK